MYALERKAPPMRAAVAVVTALVAVACGVPTWQSSLHPVDAPVPVPDSDRWLKVHTHAGDLFVLESWEVPALDESLEGIGVRFDPERAVRGEGRFTIDRDSIALLEANDVELVSTFAVGGLSVFTALSAVTTAVCLADPKSCFGSCPTFYESADADRPLAEGFSSSFARVLEARDVDRLGLQAGPGPFSLVMRNEAQETHAVRHVRLLAVPVGPGERVFQTDEGDFLATTEVVEPRSCRSEEGACLDEVRLRDDQELSPRADPHDLALREEVLLEFGAVSGPVGLVLSARHSFVSTYVFYQSLAYAGDSAGAVLAALERGEPGVEDRVLGVARALGGIEVLVREGDGPWSSAGVFREAGPIAADQQLFPMGRVDTGSLQVKLRMARGSWRVDEVALARLGDPVRPAVLDVDSVAPLGVARGGEHRLLLDPDGYLVTTRGDAHRLWFEIPDGGAYQLFLDTQGYYYEWMRRAWLAEQDPQMAAAVLLDPERALRIMAPRFKEVEGEMEGLFWSSRFRR